MTNEPGISPRPTAPSWAPSVVLPTRSMVGLGIALRLLLLVDLVLAVLSLLLSIRLDGIVDRLAEDPGSVRLRELTDLDQLVSTADTAWTCSYLATGVVWLVWLYRARDNVEAWSPQFQRSGPDAAVYSWFIPIVNLFWPARITRDILADTERDPSANWSERRLQPLVVLWAVSFAAMVLSSIWVRTKSFDVTSTDALSSLSSASIVDTVITIVAVVPAVLLVGRLTEAQQRRIELDRVVASRAG